MEHAPIETPERKAFYARIDKQNTTPLWSVIKDNARTEECLRAGAVALRRHQDGDAGSGRRLADAAPSR